MSAWQGQQQPQYPQQWGAPPAQQPPQAPQQQQWAPQGQPQAPPMWTGGPGATAPQVPPQQGGAPPPGWGQPPQPQYPQYAGQQQWGGQAQWGQQPGMCSCCDQMQGGQCCQPGACCQQYPGQQVDPYCCGPPMPEQQDTTMCCDFTCWAVGLFFILSLIGFAVVLGAHDRDDIFTTFGASNTRDLQNALVTYIPFQKNMTALCNTTTFIVATMAPTTTTAAPVTPPPPPPPVGNTTLAPNTTTTTTTTTVAPTPAPTTVAPSSWTPGCTPNTIFGSFGTYCMEDSLNAGTMVANLSHWNNFRGTLYFLAFVITTLFMFVVYAVHRQKNPQGGFMNTSMPPNGQYPVNAPIHLFDTPLYEVFRCVWFISGTIIFFWVANAMTSYWNFNKFYLDNTQGKLHDFWVAYDNKFVASVVCVTLYLAWPLALLAIEVGVWIAFVIPWFAVRCMLKPGLENVRPDVPNSEMPGWVRLDVFFTEAQQIRRLGFTPKLWELVTSSKDAFCPPLDCCQGMGMMPNQQWNQHPQMPMPQIPQNRVPGAGGMSPPAAPRPGAMDDSHEMRRIPQQPPTAVQQPQAPVAQLQQQSTGFFPGQGQMAPAQDAIVVRSTEDEEKKKEKKHKHKSKERSKEKSGTKEKKEKKHKKDKHDDSD